MNDRAKRTALSQRIKHFLLPHARNNFKPGIFAAESLALLMLVLAGIQGAYVAYTRLVMRHDSFLATVLPAALSKLANSDRSLVHAQPLQADPLLDKAAQMKAEDMATRGYFAHISPDGQTPWHWLDEVHYAYAYAGENLAIDFADSADVERAWMESPAHRANILKPEYTHVGVGIAEGVYEGHVATYIVELLASKPARTVTHNAPTPATAEYATTSHVLAAETAPTEVETKPSFSVTSIVPAASVAATSPSRLMTLLFVGLIAFLTVLLAIAILTNVRVQYLEVIGGGSVVIATLVAFLILNTLHLPQVRLPGSSQGASAASAR